MSKAICSIAICQREAWARGWCAALYARWREHGDVDADRPLRADNPHPKGSPCTVPQCPNPINSVGLCSGHYARLRQWGDIRADVPLRSVPEGTIRPKNGYLVLYSSEIPGGREYQHRLVMEQKIDRPLIAGETVHHVNGQKTDNRPDNLELWVSHQPKGQRIADLVEWAHEILDRYEKEAYA